MESATRDPASETRNLPSVPQHRRSPELDLDADPGTGAEPGHGARRGSIGEVPGRVRGSVVREPLQRVEPPADDPLLDDRTAQPRSAPAVLLPSSAVLETEALRAHEQVQGRFRRVRAVAGLLEWIGSLAAVLVLADAVLTVGSANPSNVLVQLTGAVGPLLAAPVDDLFQPADPRLALVLNHGSAAVLWLVVACLLGRLVRKTCL